MTMTSRQRVLAAANLQTPDRVPVDFSANRFVLERLARDLGTPDYLSLARRLRTDIVDLRGLVDPIYVGPGLRETPLPGGVTRNVWGMHSKVMQTAMGPEECWCDFPLASSATIGDLERHPWPSVEWFDFSNFARRLEPWDEFALIASGVSVFQHPTFLRGLDAFLADLLLEPSLAEYLMDRFTSFYLAFFDRMLTAAGGRIDILRMADDIGMQDRLLIGPDLFERFFAPRIAAFADLAHRHGAKLMYHTCGAVYPLIGRLIELGVDILDPIQVSAAGMDPARIKAQFGSRVCLHGSIDTQHLLPHGTPQEVADNVRRMIALLSPQGFILAPTHVLQADVPTANILAIYETANPPAIP